MPKDHEILTSVTYEVKFAIGSREGYHGPSFAKYEVMDAISEFQKISSIAMPVKVIDCVTFVMKDYREDGWDISAICYPNSPNTPRQVKEFMMGLAEHLLYRFKQNRITIRSFPSHTPAPIDFPDTVMLQRMNAEKTHKK